MVAIRISVPRALMLGSSAVRSMPQTRVGRVMPLPMVKKVMMKSSSDTDMAMSAAPIRVERMWGERPTASQQHGGQRSDHRRDGAGAQRNDQAVFERRPEIWIAEQLAIPFEGDSAHGQGRQRILAEGKDHDQRDGRQEEQHRNRSEQAPERFRKRARFHGAYRGLKTRVRVFWNN